MLLNNTQLAAFRSEILSETDTTIVAARIASNHRIIADWYNESTSFITWKTSLTHKEIVENTSDEITIWSWTDYIALSVSVKAAWELMFNNGAINPSLDNIRTGISQIFPAGTNRTHLLAMSKRPASRAEEFFATGTGSLGTPGKLVVEGIIGPREIQKAII